MSLLMDALKRAEHTKHGARSETSSPAATAAPQPGADVGPANPAGLSLALVETETPDTAPHAIGSDSSAETDGPPPAPAAAAATSTDPVPEPTAETTAPIPALTPAPGASPSRYDIPAEAARILTASIAQRAGQRRRAIVGAIGLAAVLAMAVGSYYYYATLTQQNPYLGLPQPPPAAAEAGTLKHSDAVDTMGDGGDESDGTADAALPPAATPSAAIHAGSTTQTPWREGLPPEKPEVTQDWEPAPVDVRALRGERPVTAANTTEEIGPPAAAITITRGTQTGQVGRDLQTAYTDFQMGRLIQAEQGYRQVLAHDAGNRDALLGLAAIALRNGRPDAAHAHYRAILRRNPKDVSAQAALADLGQGRPADSEGRLKLLLAEQPNSAQLHFALANLYAEQQRWDYAQQAYFEAQRLAPEQSDYAFNLAVSLEHLGQPRLALERYRRALSLAGRGNAQFDMAVARQRIAALSADQQP